MERCTGYAMQHFDDFAHRALQLSVGCKAEVSSDGVQGAIDDAEVQAEQHGSQGAHKHTEQNCIVGHLQHPREGALEQAHR